ncbi:MAG: transposase [Anaerolineales bacterium]|nr:transposase [Anaerolineales bacterium]
MLYLMQLPGFGVITGMTVLAAIGDITRFETAGHLVWHVLHRMQPYRHFSHERIAHKYLTWSWQLSEEDRGGLTRQQFTRYYLMRLGIGHDLQRIALNPKHPRRLASEAELLALRPELTQIE